MHFEYYSIFSSKENLDLVGVMFNLSVGYRIEFSDE